MHCLKCQFLLATTPPHRCPECGRAFDPSDAESYLEADQIDTPGERCADWAAALFLGAMLATIVLIGSSIDSFSRSDGSPDLGGLALRVIPPVLTGAVAILALLLWYRSRRSAAAGGSRSGRAYGAVAGELNELRRRNDD